VISEAGLSAGPVYIAQAQFDIADSGQNEI
jgi:hypothetical protein